MDFSDLCSYPLVTSMDSSPTIDAIPYPDPLDSSYLVNTYTTLPDYNFPSVLDHGSLFDCSVPTTETYFAPTTMSYPVFNKGLQSSSTRATHSNLIASSTVEHTPFGHIRDVTEGFGATGLSNNAFSVGSASRDTLQPETSAATRLSSRSPKRELSSDVEEHNVEEPTAKRHQRKRGRPRLNRSSTASSDGSYQSTPAGKEPQPHRVPHNQVERRYREGLNMELERLRRAVPALPQSDDSNSSTAMKPSKAMVLAAAIEYIKKTEWERDAAIEEIERLGGRIRFDRMSLNGATREG